jgi:hypothetical protein
MHLTNYAINKRNQKFTVGTSHTTDDDNTGHKRSIKSMLKVILSLTLQSFTAFGGNAAELSR